jgi:hypothetical protein
MDVQDQSTSKLSIATSEILKETNEIIFGVSQQGPHYEGQVSHASVAMSQKDQDAPKWVDKLLDRLGHIESRLDNIDQKLTKLDALESKFELLSTDLLAVKSDIAKINDRSDHLEFDILNTNDMVKEVAKKQESLQDEILDIQARSMRDNLVFFNIPEYSGPRTEDVEETVRAFIKDSMKMPVDQCDNLRFERVHRSGPLFGLNRPRKIIAKFSSYKQKEEVRKLGKNLKDSNFYVHEQFPPAIIEQRRKLFPVMKAARLEGKRANVVYNKLYIDGKQYIPGQSNMKRSRDQRSPQQLMSADVPVQPVKATRLESQESSSSDED